MAKTLELVWLLIQALLEELGETKTVHMEDRGVLAVTFELGRDFYVARPTSASVDSRLVRHGQGLGNPRPSRRCRQGPPAVNERLVRQLGCAAGTGKRAAQAA